MNDGYSMFQAQLRFWLQYSRLHRDTRCDCQPAIVTTPENSYLRLIRLGLGA